MSLNKKSLTLAIEGLLVLDELPALLIALAKYRAPDVFVLEVRWRRLGTRLLPPRSHRRGAILFIGCETTRANFFFAVRNLA